MEHLCPLHDSALRPNSCAQSQRMVTRIRLPQARAVRVARDALAGAQTGTGKTAAFALPILQLLSGRARRVAGTGNVPRALVLAPTRELAAQVGESFETYGAHLALHSTVIFGGVSINPQKAALRRGVDILVATPGRLLDHIGQRSLDLSGIEILVLDKADRMLDMGFIHDIRKILALLPKCRQNLLFSAAYTNEIKRLADGQLHQPALIEVARRCIAAETVTQHVYRVQQDAKRDLLIHLVEDGRWLQVLMFARTKHGANRLVQQLNRAGIEATAIHGNKIQAADTQALARFKSNHVRVLVATDIAARGLDIDRLPHVVNYELPNVPEDYVRRIGRTGRACEQGAAVSLVSDAERTQLHDIQRLLKRDIAVLPPPEYASKALAPAAKPEAKQRPRSGAGRQGYARQLSGSAAGGNDSPARRPRNRSRQAAGKGR